MLKTNKFSSSTNHNQLQSIHYSTNQVKDEKKNGKKKKPFQTKVDLGPAAHFTSSNYVSYI